MLLIVLRAINRSNTKTNVFLNVLVIITAKMQSVNLALLKLKVV